MKKYLVCSALLFLLATAVSAAPADESFKKELFEATGQASGAAVEGGVADVRLIVVKAVNMLLSMLGIVFLGLTVYAGFLYMTARGESDQVEKAMHIVRRAVTGLIIVFLSFALTEFVFFAALGGPGGYGVNIRGSGGDTGWNAARPLRCLVGTLSRSDTLRKSCDWR